MTHRIIALSELIKPALLSRAGSTEYPILSMTMHHGLVKQSEKFKKRVASLDTSTYKVVERGQLVVGFPIDEGVLSFQRSYDQAIVSPAYDIWNIADLYQVDTRYLERYLRSPRALTYYRSRLRGTTARRRSLPKDIFLALPVKLPDLADQQRIANILDSLDALRARRRKAVTLLEDLAQSIFLDMFGDPLVNPKGWQRLQMREFLTRIDSGQSPVCLDRPAEPSEWGVLKLGAVTKNVYLPDQNKALPGDRRFDERNEVRAGDLLFSRKNTAELVAASAYVRQTRERLLLPDLIFRMVVRDKSVVCKIYLHALLTCPPKRRKLQELATGSAASMPNISKSRIMEFECEIPPLHLQQIFASRLDTLAEARQVHSAHLAELDALFASLQHRAFSGTLALRDPA